MTVLLSNPKSRDKDAIVDSIKEFLGADDDSIFKGSGHSPTIWRGGASRLRERQRYGLDFFETRLEVVSYDKMSEIAAFGGFDPIPTLAIWHGV